MPLPKLALLPEDSRYSAAPGAAVRRAAVPGGRGRHRLDQIGAPTMVDVTFSLDRDEYLYLGAFYRRRSINGSRPFLMDLVLDAALPTEQVVQFMPGSPKLSNVSGERHIVSATLEVATPARNKAADLALVAARAAPVDGLPVMALTPSSDGYGVERGETVIRSRDGQGPGRFRLDYPNTGSLLAIVWHVGPADYEYLLAFYFSTIAEGALPFRIEAVHDHPDARQLKAMLVPGSFSLEGVRGLRYTIRAQVEVVPIASPDEDEITLMNYEETDPETALAISLAHVVNITMPTWN